MAAEFELIFNEKRFRQDFQRIVGNALRQAGMIAMEMMTKHVMSLDIHNFRGDWKQEIASKINMKIEKETDSAMSMLVGLIDQDDEWFMMRAHILEYGMGSAADPAGGGDLEPVSHVQGVAGINDDVTGYAPISDTPTFLLPDSWNHPPGHWFKDSATLLSEVFDEIMSQALNMIDLLDYIEQKGDWTIQWTVSL